MSTLFDHDRPWLQDLPYMRDWEAGCLCLVQQLETWTNHYVLPLWDSALTEEDRIHLYQRFWQFWRDRCLTSVNDTHHVVAPGEAAKNLANGLEKKNRLPDVALVAALLCQQQRAFRYFDQRFKQSILSCVAKINRRLANDPAFWQDLVVRLCFTGERNLGQDDQLGQPQSPPVLERYHWSHPLWNFVRTIACNAAIDQLRKSGVEPLLGDIPDGDSQVDPGTRLMRDECQKLFGAALREFVRQLKPSDRLFLQLMWVHKDGEGRPLQGQQIALALGISGAKVSTTKKRLHQKLTDCLRPGQHLPAEIQSGYADCFGADPALPNQPGLIDLLEELLKETGDEQSHGGSP